MGNLGNHNNRCENRNILPRPREGEQERGGRRVGWRGREKGRRGRAWEREKESEGESEGEREGGRAHKHSHELFAVQRGVKGRSHIHHGGGKVLSLEVLKEVVCLLLAPGAQRVCHL